MCVDGPGGHRYPCKGIPPASWGSQDRRPTQREEVRAIARIDELIDKVDSKFTLVHLAAKRAREINDYYAQLGEGLGQHMPPLVSTESNKPLSIALDEIAQGKVEPRWTDEAVPVVDPLAFIESEERRAES